MMVSIIVPVYNVERYLEQCILSILSQTYRDFELLLIDDGSTDLSGVICDKYAHHDSRIVVYHKCNGGLSSARNVGISNAKGKYVIFVDSDDYWCSPFALNSLLECAVQNNADIVRGEVSYVDETGAYLWDNRTKQKTKCANIPLSNASFISNIICGKWWVWISLYKADKLLKFNEEQKFQEDIDFHIKLFSQKLKCVYLPLVFYSYRIRQGSLVNSINKASLYDSFKLCYTFKEYSNLCCDESLMRIYHYYCIMMYYWNLHSLSECFYSERKQIIIDFDLREIQKMVLNLAKYNIFKYPIPVFLNPELGCVIMAIYIRLKKTVRSIITRVFKR